MRISILSAVIGLGLVAGAGGSALWLKLRQPDRVAAYITLFDTHCRSRIAARAAGRDPLSDLPTDQAKVLRHKADLIITQTTHRCEISEDKQLLNTAERDQLEQDFAAYMATSLPLLIHPADAMPSFDLLRGFLLQAPGQSNNGQWGALIMRIEPDSGNALQRTAISLTLPRG